MRKIAVKRFGRLGLFLLLGICKMQDY